MAKMTKVEIIEEIRRGTGMGKGEIACVLASFQEVVKEAVLAGDEIELRDFFTIKQGTARAVKYNLPISGAIGSVPPRPTLKIAISPSWIDSVRASATEHETSGAPSAMRRALRGSALLGP